MGAGLVLEPLVVVILLFGGAWINRATESSLTRVHPHRRSAAYPRAASPGAIESGYASSTPKVELTNPQYRSRPPETGEIRWRKRQIGIFGLSALVVTPDTTVFRGRLLSRLLQRLPFLVECWYWALVYWTYQLGRALTAVTLQESTVDVARRHALQMIQVEKQLGIFYEPQIQHFFLGHPVVMACLNWVYSFIHIPGTIAFLVCLYYYTVSRNCVDKRQPGKPRGGLSLGPLLYQSRRRTLAVCNLLAFAVFTLWPCMPPRLLSAKDDDLARSYGFVDTVHGTNGAGSVWTENRFCNNYAAMPSLHFGYSLMIGLTTMTMPLSSPHRRATRSRLGRSLGLRVPSWDRLMFLVLGFLYPFIILIAIVATANHFILDAIAGALVCILGWRFNGILLNLLPLEDFFLWSARIHKPELSSTRAVSRQDDWESDGTESGRAILVP